MRVRGAFIGHSSAVFANLIYTPPFPMKIISPHSFYSCAAHDEVLAQWNKRSGANSPLVLDLSSAACIDPYGLVALTLFLNHLPDSALPVKLCLDGFPPPGKRDAPSQNEVIETMTRMGFWEEVGAKLDIPEKRLPVRPQWSDDNGVLIDITILHGRDAINVMLRKTGEILHNLKFSPISRGHVMEVLSELSSNVLDHAQSDYGGVVATQTYTSMRSGTRYLVMSIGDMGIGVRASIAKNEKLQGRLESDGQALGIAVQAGNSRFETGGRGGGLPRVVEIARRYGGSVALRSGTGALAFHGEGEQRRVFEAAPQIGTQLRIMLPENRLVE